MNIKICSKCKTEKDFSCFNKSKAGKFGLKAECKVCSSLRFKEHYENNRDVLIKKSRDFRESNPEYAKQYWVEYYKNNRQDCINKSLSYNKSLTKQQRSSINSKYYQRNKSTVRKSNRRWMLSNPSKSSFYSATRRSLKKRATIKSLSVKDLEDIYSYYLLAKELSLASGISFCVDHIVPLSNSIVCGLNVPWNLQILTTSENCSKNNKFYEKDDYGIN